MRLSKEQLGPDPISALTTWFDGTRAVGFGGEHAFTLATVDPSGAPDARVVIGRNCNEEGLTYYADTRSLKSRDLSAEPRACMVGYWPQLARQARIRGAVTVLPDADADAAFATRTRRSQIGYWANTQSEPISDRAALERQLDAVIQHFDGRETTRPEHWAVYRLRPHYLEFWQSGERHLHDRIAYTLAADGVWHVERL